MRLVRRRVSLQVHARADDYSEPPAAQPSMTVYENDKPEGIVDLDGYARFRVIGFDPADIEGDADEE